MRTVSQDWPLARLRVGGAVRCGAVIIERTAARVTVRQGERSKPVPSGARTAGDALDTWDDAPDPWPMVWPPFHV